MSNEWIVVYDTEYEGFISYVTDGELWVGFAMAVYGAATMAEAQAVALELATKPDFDLRLYGEEDAPPVLLGAHKLMPDGTWEVIGDESI